MISIAADLGGTNIKIGLIKDGDILASTQIKAFAEDTIAANLQRVNAAARELIADTDISGNPVKGIGISFPGIVDSDNNRVLSDYVKYKNAHRFDFSGWADESWTAPCIVENDARAALLGEWAKGAGREYNNIVLLTLGTGVGSAVLIEGTLLKGRNFMAGSLGGHLSINLNGETCNCGYIGCLETEASTWNLSFKAKKHPRFLDSKLSKYHEIQFDTLFQEADNGDFLAKELVSNCLKAWGIGVVNMVHAYDPEIVIIGGGIMKKRDMILPVLSDMVKKYAWAPAAHAVKILPSAHVEYAGLLGMDYLISKIK